MKNNFKKIAFENWHWIVFFVFSFFILSFLIFPAGVWSFTDSGFYYADVLQARKVALSKLGIFSNTDGFYLGFDNSAGAFSHLAVSWYQFILSFIFGSHFGQVVYYFIYYFLSFLFGLLLFKKLFLGFGKNSIRVGALFLAFNPFSLLISTLFAISYIYALTIVFLYLFLCYLENGKIKNLFFSLLAALYLFSYLRLVPIIVLLLFFVLWIFYDKKYFSLKRWVLFLTALFFVCSPYFVGNLPILGGSNNIINNYQDAFERYQEANYDFKSSFLNSLTNPGGFTPSALSFFYNNRGIPEFADNFAVKGSFEFYKMIQLIFNSGILIFAIAFVRSKKAIKLIALICFFIFLNTLGFFLNIQIYTLIHKSLLVFLYNDYGFLQFAQSFFFALLLVSVAEFVKDRDNKKYALYLVLAVTLYLVLNISPFLSNYYGFKKVNDIPLRYSEYLFSKEKIASSEATLFAPYNWLKFEWSPYFLDLNSFHSSEYKSLISPNLRLVSDDFVKFYNQIYDNLGKENIDNISIFNIKNIFVFKDVVDAEKQIDTYQVTNVEYNSQKMILELKNQESLNLVEENENFNHYRFNSADDYDFLIYSPKNLINLNSDQFYDKNFHSLNKPLIFDKTKLNNINIIRDINFKLNSPYISFKTIADNSNKYYVKINVNKEYPFLLHFNQSFSKNWQIFFVDSSDWESRKCIAWGGFFKLTENDYCVSAGTAIDFNDFLLFFKKRLKPENHFLGNMVGNTFLITPQDIPESYRQGNELYLIIYFKRQIYYLMALIVSFSVFVMIFVFMIREIMYDRTVNKKK